ncbi:TM2 domain-containing protein [Pusillimonas noertemannii]|uniref:TM2 domain-containing protein n=2 Tax=Pusillimonas noertemannii TaxID=305977 RepID=A0A2U1CRF8_9BURK|nr:TM2 domain-containing protein [Pusillimonas noertemannii]
MEQNRSAAAGRTEPAWHRSKVIVALLAAMLGVFGAHWWYLGRPRAWMVTLASCVLIVLAQFYPVWWDNPPFLLLIVPVTAGFIEALVFSLKPDAWFDARYNAGSGKTTRTGWGPVLIAIFTTLLGSSVMLFGIALIVMHVYKALGWLDGYVL